MKQAINAKDSSEEADRIEKLQIMIMGYSSSVDIDEPFSSYLSSRVGKEIDRAFQVPAPKGTDGRVNAVQVGEHYYIIYEEENGNYTIEELNTDLGSVGGRNNNSNSRKF